MTSLDRPRLDDVSDKLPPPPPPASTNPCRRIMLNSDDSVRLMNIIMTMNMCIACSSASYCSMPSEGAISYFSFASSVNMSSRHRPNIWLTVWKLEGGENDDV